MKKQLLLLVGLLFSGSQYTRAQVTLAAGDLAFIGYNTDAQDGFAFITLADIPASCKIYFTDEGIVNSSSWVGSSEDHYLFTAPVGGVSCGTIITITDADGSGATIVGAAGATFVWQSGGTTNNFNLSAGDQIIAYQVATPGVPASPSSATFIAGVHGDDGNGTPTCLDGSTGWNETSCTVGVSKSVVPLGLTNGVNCVSLFPSIGTETDNARYNGTLTGSSTTLRALINDHTNWISDDGSAYDISPGVFSPSVTCTASAGNWDGSTSTDWNVASNWTGNVVPTALDNIVIPSAPSNQPHVTLAPGTPAVCNNITIDAGATLTVDAGKALTISGTLANAGTVQVKADASGIGSLITNGTISGAGSFRMEQYLTGSGGATPDGVFYYVSSPIPNATAANYNVDLGNKLWIDQEPSQNYAQLTFGGIPLEVGQGYIARMGSTGAINFSGTSFNTGSITEGGLTRTGTTEVNRGYNLVGNPYPSTVDWNTADRTNLEVSIWYRTHNGSTMTFDTYNLSGSGMGTNNNGGGNVSNLIPPTQAFWVRVDADGNTGSITFDNADRSHGTLAGIYKAEAETGTVRMVLGNGTTSDEAIVRFDTDAQDNFDDYDSHKFWASDIPQLYMNTNEDTLVINGLTSTANNPVVDLGVILPSSGNYTLNANSITIVGESVHLEDRLLNIFQDLNVEPNYSFSSNAGNIGDRFALHFGMSSVGITDAINRVSTRVYSSNGQLNIILSENIESGNAQVLDMAGRIVNSFNLNATRTSIAMNVTEGVYLIRVETEKGVDTHRIIFN